MKRHLMLPLALLAFVVISIGCNKPAETSAAPAPEQTAKQNVEQTTAGLPTVEGDRVIVYYFHGNRRCPTCKMIESMTTEVVTTTFPDQVSAGTLEVKSVNVEDPANKPFVEHFKLFNSSVVLVEYKQGQEVKSQKLPEVWPLSHQRDQFLAYVSESITKFLAGPQ